MSRLTNEERATKARQTLIETIAKIADLEPTLGGKWKRKMLAYYTHCLAELVLYQSGFLSPIPCAVVEVQRGIYAALNLEGYEV